MAKKIVFMKDFVESQWGRTVLGSNVLANYASNDTGDVHTEYVKNITEINDYMIGLLKTELPVFTSKIPEHYSDYVKYSTVVKADALKWNDTINAKLLSVPSSSIKTLINLSGTFDNALKCVSLLIDDPASKEMKKQLGNKITQAQVIAEDVYDEIISLINEMQNFHDNMPNDAEKLAQAAALMVKDKDADSAKIKELEKLIDQMNDEIVSLSAEIAALAVADGVSLIVGGLAVYAAGPIGILTWIFLGAAIAVATYCIVVDAEEIKDLKKQIESKQREIGEYNTTISLLNESAKQYKKLADDMKKLQDNLTKIADEWKKIASGLKEMNDEIDKASNHYTKEDWKSVKSDLTKAKTKCDNIIGPIKELDISNMSATKAELHVGMNQQELKNAINSAVSVSVVDYIRSLA